MDMLSTAKIFSNDRQILGDYTNLHTIMSWLDKNQCIIVKDIILELKNYCDAQGILSLLESANANVIKDNPILKNPSNTRVTDVQRNLFKEAFIRRLELMKDYVKNVYNNDKVNPDRKFWIRSTGSDPHNKGQHALYLVDKKSGKKTGVYKAHDLRADAAIIGKNGMFDQINSLIGTAFEEKCLELGLNTGEGNNKAFVTMDIDIANHTEPFMKKVDKMSSENAKLYFFRAGMLKVISKAMAILDLHQDNIMATSAGPLIIDAEVDFFDYSDENLERALSYINVEGENRPSTFEITDKSGNIPSGKAWNEPTYHGMYEQGYNFMLEHIENMIDKYKQRYINLLDNIGKVRIVPIITGMFGGYLDEGIKCPKTDDDNYLKKEQRTDPVNSKGTRQEYASFLADKIEEKLTTYDEFKSKPFVFRNRDSGEELKAVVEDKNILTKAIKKTFDNGTIIAMYADIDGNIYLDETIVAKIYLNDQLISRDKLKEKMGLKFKNVVESLKKFNL